MDRSRLPELIDRAEGVLLGLAAGDALGAGYEFQDHPPADPEMIGGGPFGFAPGEWTDDTQMAICVAQVAATGVLDAAEVGERFLRWFGHGPRDVGNQTRLVLAAARDAGELMMAAAEYYRLYPNASAGNGSLMRTAPVALAHLGNDDAIAESARAVSGLTHADPLAGDACVLWCIAIDRAVREARLDGAREGIAQLDATARQTWAGWLDEAERQPPATFRANGFVVTALQAAHAAVQQTPVPADGPPSGHLVAALKAAVHIGNDTDTVAAIAGSLLGARWGASAVPESWRRKLHGWPGFDATDLMSLARRAAAWP